MQNRIYYEQEKSTFYEENYKLLIKIPVKLQSKFIFILHSLYFTSKKEFHEKFYEKGKEKINEKTICIKYCSNDAEYSFQIKQLNDILHCKVTRSSYSDKNLKKLFEQANTLQKQLKVIDDIIDILFHFNFTVQDLYGIFHRIQKPFKCARMQQKSILYMQQHNPIDMLYKRLKLISKRLLKQLEQPQQFILYNLIQFLILVSISVQFILKQIIKSCLSSVYYWSRGPPIFNCRYSV